ncbi:MAG: hypothetical protein R6V07_05400 [Armatimonadota bacterium]
MAHTVDDAKTDNCNTRPFGSGTDEEVRAIIERAVAADTLTARERRERTREALEACAALRERLLEEMDGPLPAGWTTRMIREGRP